MTPLFSPKITRWAWLVLSASLYLLLGYGTARSSFGPLLGLFALLFWGYWLRVRPLLHTHNQPKPDRFLLGAAVLFRLLLLLALPALSDDYARFVWDGKLLLQGVNPFQYLPAEIMAGGLTPTVGADPALFRLLNSPNYYTVYPPVGQVFFALATWASPGSLFGSVVMLRLPLLLAELGTLWLMVRLLQRAGQNPNLALLYGLNPLVALELTGNVHFEALMIFFGLLSVYLWQRQRSVLSAGALALAIATKLLPVLALPVLFSVVGWRRAGQYTGWVALFSVLLFAPFLNLTLLLNMLESIDLYFRKFEFNASVYYLVRAVGYWLTGYNVVSQIGLWLSLLTTVLLLVIAFAKQHAPPVRLLWMLTVYLAMATTVHPWYVTTLVAVAVFARPLSYALLWSGLVWLSYSAYQTLPIREQPVLLLLEYVPVLVLFVYQYRHYQQTLRRHAQTPAEV